LKCEFADEFDCPEMTLCGWPDVKIQLLTNLHKRESMNGHGSRRPQAKTVDFHQQERPVLSLRWRGVNPRRKEAVGRKSKQPSHHPQLMPVPAQSAVGSAHQKADFYATNGHARANFPSPYL